MTESDVVVWADPGLITGLAQWDQERKVFTSWQYEDTDLVERLRMLAHLHGERLVVGYESYLVAGGPRSGTPKYSLQVIGQINELATEGLFRLAQPVPSSSRKLGSVAWLRRLGWYKPGKRHANDAAMHLLAYLLKQKPMDRHIRDHLFPGYKTGATITT